MTTFDFDGKPIPPDEVEKRLNGVVMSMEGGEEWCYLDGPPPPRVNGSQKPPQPAQPAPDTK